MKVQSVNVGMPRSVVWNGRTVTTGIFKAPTAKRTLVRALNLDGDGQADLSVHGGPDKAVYAYPAEHYAFWKELRGESLEWGRFGENLTTTGLLEETVHIGDRFRIGSVELVVTQPRQPCYKLGLRFQDDGIIRQFLESRRTGFYFAVTQEGWLRTRDSIELIGKEPDPIAVSDIVRLFVEHAADPDLLARARNTKALPESWKDWQEQRSS